ncbi:MAG: efflux RND transporter periplasmic adaptor subunit [Rhodocyclaceae bacterium]|nr:efflux RND transporter periplasmic adaptor subunit [Rhodocyclaceae bacterium]
MTQPRSGPASAGLLLALAVAGALAGCDRKPEEKKASGPPPAIVTVTQVRSGGFEVVEETLGTLEALIDPKIGAEVAGRVASVSAGTGKAVRRGELLATIDPADLTLQNEADRAETKRLEALLAQQDALVGRQEQLAAKGFLSPNAADDARAQRTALREQLAAARARAALSGRAVGKAGVTAPDDGHIETQIVSPGDYVKVGDPLFQFVSNRRLRAHLPFPESAMPRLARGQAVRMTSPQVPGRQFEGRITEIKPGIVEGSRNLDVLVDIDNRDGSLRGGGTVNAAVLIARRADTLTVPEQSVVLRPAGKVVYAVVEGRARQKAVQTGAKRSGLVEILGGVQAGDTVVLDGAGFLTDGAAVTIKEKGPAKPGGAAR